jgi:hypothetical protein
MPYSLSKQLNPDLLVSDNYDCLISFNTISYALNSYICHRFANNQTCPFK